MEKLKNDTKSNQANKNVTSLKVVTDSQSKDNNTKNEIKKAGEETSANGIPKGNQPGAKEAIRKQLTGAVTIEGITKWVEDMNYLKKGRAKLIEDTTQLRDFEVQQRDEPQHADSNYWNGCKIELVDDSRRSYTLRNPVMIGAVIKFMYETFETRREEIDIEILEKANSYPYHS